MVRWLSMAAVILLGALGAWTVWKQERAGDGAEAARQPPAVTVTTAEAETATWHPTLTAVGSLRALRSVDVTPEVGGQVESVHFASGRRVDEGDLLVQLDDDRDRAELANLEAQRQLARLTLQRTEKLAHDGHAAQSDLDQARSEYRSLEARIEAQRGLIAEKRVAAPFAGTLGIRRVEPGQYVSPGAGLVRLTDLTDLRVDFSLPQRHLNRVAPGQTVHFTVDAYPGRRFEGRVTAVAPELDRQTRSFRVEAALGNPDRLLRPGLFVDVALPLPEARTVVTVPQTAVSHNPYGDIVYQVEASGDGPPVARQAFVTVGKRRGSVIGIEDGLAAGRTVVTSGLHKLQDGTPLTVDNTVTPDRRDGS